MNIELNKLYKDGNIFIDDDITLDVRENSLGIKSLENLHLQGKVLYTDTEDLILGLVFSGDILLCDAVSLDEIKYHFETNIDEEISEDDINLDNYIDKTKNILDISDILWQNIVLEVPIRVKKDNEEISLSGDGWQLNNNEKEEIDPRLAKLNELFKEGKE